MAFPSDKSYQQSLSSSIYAATYLASTESFPRSETSTKTRIEKGIKRSATENLLTSKESPSLRDLKRAKISSLKPNTKHSTLGKVGKHFVKLIDKCTKLPTDHFSDTDLLIYPKDWEGILPLNGIKQNEYDRIYQLYVDLQSGKGTFQIEGSDDFKKMIIDEGFKKIVLRAPGREVIFLLMEAGPDKQIHIKPTTQPSGGEVSFKKSSNPNIFGEIVINIHGNHGNVIGLKNGLRIISNTSTNLVLLHELVHCCHKLKGDIAFTKRRSNLGDQFDNLLEQVAITGIRKPFSLLSDDTAECYNPLNENRYRAACGEIPRIGVLGCDLTKLDIEKEISEKSAASEAIPLEKTIRGRYFLDLAGNGLVPEMKEFLTTNKEFIKLIDVKAPGNLFERALERAAECDEIDSFEFLIKIGARPYHSKVWSKPVDPIEFEKKGLWYLTYWAARKGPSKIMRKLLSNPGLQKNINLSLDNSTILYSLIAVNSMPLRINTSILELIRFLISIGANPNIPSSAGLTCAHYAASNGSLEVLKILSEAGANVNLHSLNGYTPFMLAAVKGHTEILQFLLSRGVNGDTLTPSGDTVLHTALRIGTMQEIVQMIKKSKEMNFHVKGAKNQTVIHCIMQNRSLSNNDQLMLTKLFWEKGVALNEKDNNGKTFLHFTKDQNLVKTILLNCKKPS